jgi:hypothetical protein
MSISSESKESAPQPRSTASVYAFAVEPRPTVAKKKTAGKGDQSN